MFAMAPLPIRCCSCSWRGRRSVCLGLTRPLFLPSVRMCCRNSARMLMSGESRPAGASPCIALLPGLRSAVVVVVVVACDVPLAMGCAGRSTPWYRSAFRRRRSRSFRYSSSGSASISLSKILLVAFTCVLPMVVATYHGAIGVSRTVIWSAEAMGTSESRMLYRVILPACMPYVFSGDARDRRRWR